MLGRLTRNGCLLKHHLQSNTTGSATRPHLNGIQSRPYGTTGNFSKIPQTTVQVTGDSNLEITQKSTGNILAVKGASFLELKAPQSEIEKADSLVHKIINGLDATYSARSRSCGKYIFTNKAISPAGLSNKWKPELVTKMADLKAPCSFGTNFREKVQAFDSETSRQLHDLFFDPKLQDASEDGPIRRVEIKRVVTTENLKPALDLVREMIREHDGEITSRSGGPNNDVNQTKTMLGGNVYVVDDPEYNEKNHGKIRQRVYAQRNSKGQWEPDPQTNGRSWLEFKAKHVGLSQKLGGNMCQKPRYLVSDVLLDEYAVNPTPETISALFADAERYTENQGRRGEGDSLRTLLMSLYDIDLAFEPEHCINVERESFAGHYPSGITEQ